MVCEDVYNVKHASFLMNVGDHCHCGLYLAVVTPLCNWAFSHEWLRILQALSHYHLSNRG